MYSCYLYIYQIYIYKIIVFLLSFFYQSGSDISTKHITQKVQGFSYEDVTDTTDQCQTLHRHHTFVSTIVKCVLY